MEEPVTIPCVHCEALNRIPRVRLADKPVCGRCKQPLFAGKPVELTDRNFAAIAERGDVPLLIDFWAAWCGPCQQFAPTFTAAARALEPHVRLVKLDTDANPAVAGRFHIRSIPTLIFLHQGREIARQAGAMDARSLERWVSYGLEQIRGTPAR
ncbi:thioredoxin TrxC [Tahibacter amnicola]|uniref:Thioredoxin n=1 Tax=Tahibacter amnicola TaxID=2976241 RepID=A0ABY6BMU8_9GAMM|nr:thioredoxin TrxC [Tahibacter amnicola]UXI69896.1 thioredoxin TrxC [Tahibacter amnicola]